MFVGRKAELRELNSLYDSGKFECVAVYGRRHIGKTALISEFIKDKDAIYFSARELTDKYNLEAFKSDCRALWDSRQHCKHLERRYERDRCPPE